MKKSGKMEHLYIGGVVQLTTSESKLFHKEMELGKMNAWNNLHVQKEYYTDDDNYIYLEDVRRQMIDGEKQNYELS